MKKLTESLRKRHGKLSAEGKRRAAERRLYARKNVSKTKGKTKRQVVGALFGQGKVGGEGDGNKKSN